MPNGHTNIATVSLDANELKFAADGSLTIAISHDEPADAEGRANCCRHRTASSR